MPKITSIEQMPMRLHADVEVVIPGHHLEHIEGKRWVLVETETNATVQMVTVVENCMDCGKKLGGNTEAARGQWGVCGDCLAKD